MEKKLIRKWFNDTLLYIYYNFLHNYFHNAAPDPLHRIWAPGKCTSWYWESCNPLHSQTVGLQELFHMQDEEVVARCKIETISEVAEKLPTKTLNIFLLKVVVCGSALSWKRITLVVSLSRRRICFARLSFRQLCLLTLDPYILTKWGASCHKKY